ncbi:MAG: hypothetical protein AB7C97_11880 [Oscillospiraceae bacterium]
MRDIASKLKSRRGASMIIALVFFLLCVTVSAIILTAAETNAGRIRVGRETQDAYLAVSSAGRLLRESIGGSVYTVTEYSVSSDCGNHTTPPAERDEPAGQFGSALAALCESSLPASCQMTFTGDVQEVSATLTMTADYSITVRLDITASDVENYPMTLTFGAETQDYTTVSHDTHEYTDTEGNPALCEVVTTTDVWSVTWDAGAIAKGGV